MTWEVLLIAVGLYMSLGLLMLMTIGGYSFGRLLTMGALTALAGIVFVMLFWPFFWRDVVYFLKHRND